MMSHDLPAFAETFDGLARMLARRMDDGERSRLLADYFKALRSYPIEAVQAGAEIIAQQAKHFPKPIEWREAMPRLGAERFVPLMDVAEARIWREAERRVWEGDPCSCDACRRAKVDWKPIRFVPETDADGRDRLVKDGARDKVIVAGHWAHGEELAGYYRAKAACMTRFVQEGHGAVLKLIAPPKQSGDTE